MSVVRAVLTGILIYMYSLINWYTLEAMMECFNIQAMCAYIALYSLHYFISHTRLTMYHNLCTYQIHGPSPSLMDHHIF